MGCLVPHSSRCVNIGTHTERHRVAIAGQKATGMSPVQEQVQGIVWHTVPLSELLLLLNPAGVKHSQWSSWCSSAHLLGHRSAVLTAQD